MDSGFWTWSKYLNLDLKKIQYTFVGKMDLDRKSDLIIWIQNGCGMDH